jgi:hypothetical protein
VSEGSRGGAGPFAEGDLVAGYRLEEQIGQGGMAVVFRAHDPRLDRDVALKILAPSLAEDAAFRQRFIRESRAAAAVDHPHIIPVFEAGEERGVLFIAMRFVRGGDVRSLLDRDGPLSPARTTEIISQVASALDAAHARGLVHRDVKPGNMLLDVSADNDRPDHVYLSDFGLTKTSLAASGLTSTGQFLGTLDYVAPEQIEGRPVDGRTDLYALACATFELLTGAPPFRRHEGMAVMYAQVSEPPPLLSSRRRGLPPGADEIMNRALAKAPDDRYQSCREFAAGLRRVFGLRSGDSDPRAQAPGRPPTQVVAPGPRPPAGPAADAGTAVPADAGAADAGAGVASGGGDRGGVGDAAAAAAAAAVAAAGAASGAAESRPEEPVPSPGGPPTQAAVRPTRPGLTEPHGGSGGPAAPGDSGGSGGSGDAGGADVTGRARRPWWRSPVPLAVICAIVVVVGGGGGYFLLGRASGSSGGGGGGAGGGHTLTAPGCTTATPKLTGLTSVKRKQVKVGGSPFAIQESNNHRYVFVTVSNGIAVLQTGSGLTPTLIRTIAIPGADQGLAMTSDGRYLLAAGRQGAVVISVAEAEQGALNPVTGTLASPPINGVKGIAVGVKISPGDQYAFVTLENTTKMAVFNLAKALSSGFGPSDFVGFVPLGVHPVGISGSPDGKWLYVTSSQRTAGPQPSEGTLSVVSMHGAETDPKTSVVATVNAGCSPARIVTASDGATVWVTAKQSNAVLAFSAAKLTSDPSHALLAVVRVGSGPIGLAPVGGNRIVVADSNSTTSTRQDGDLAVINTAAALAGKPALLGAIPATGQPHQFDILPHGVLLVTEQVTGLLQAMKMATLP